MFQCDNIFSSKVLADSIIISCCDGSLPPVIMNYVHALSEFLKYSANFGMTESRTLPQLVTLG